VPHPRTLADPAQRFGTLRRGEAGTQVDDRMPALPPGLRVQAFWQA